MQTLKVGSTGPDVRALQAAINKRARPRGLPTVAVDGQYGPQTDAAAAASARALGALESTIAKTGTSIGEQRIIRWPATRSPAQYARARARKSGPTNTFTGSPVPGQRPVPATHQTAGLAGFPAVDYFAPAGSPCVSPVTGKVTRLSGHDPAGGPVNGVHGPFGWSCYIEGAGKTYYLTHMGARTVKAGQSVKQGEKIGTVGDYARWGGTNHIHCGVHG